MADPIGILSLVLQLTPKVIRFVLDIKEGSEERRQLITEISSVSGILSVLQKLQEDPHTRKEWDTALSSLGGPGGPLQSYADLLESVQESLKIHHGGRKRIERGLTWPFRKKTVQGYLVHVERYKSIFSLAVQLDNRQLGL